MDTPLNIINNALIKLRAEKPLITNITNFVVMNNTANALLAIGASPLMAHCPEELEELIAISGAVVINIGTLDRNWINSMFAAVEMANKLKKPIILDPVGCGASNLRTQVARDLFSASDNLIVRANSAEICALVGYKAQQSGVDSADNMLTARNGAAKLIEQKKCNIVISGAIDSIISAHTCYAIDNGSKLMPYVTGMGCTHSAISAAFAAIGETTGLAASAVMAIAGELASMRAQGPGSLQVEFLDMLYKITPSDIEKYLKVETIASL